MKQILSIITMAVFGMSISATTLLAQTEGSVELNAKILNMSGNGDDHWTVAWVTKADGTFIKTIWRQGPSITRSKWNDHCSAWWAAKNGSTAIDGRSGATARNYNSPNSPVIQTWDCHDTDGNLMPDGDYKFWVQYAEDSSHSQDGPVTTAGLLWTKGGTPSTTTYSNQGSNFSNMKVVWSPVLPPNVDITSVNVQGSAIIITGTGTVSATYAVIGSANLNQSVDAWSTIQSGTINGAGNFSNSIPIDAESPSGYYRVKIP
jgi:hypothetical protein